MASAQEFDPREFLQLAESLAQRAIVSEAEARTAISRSYYAAHLYARERLIAVGRLSATDTGADHQLVIRALRSLGGPEGDEVDWLRLRRTRCDYNLRRRITKIDAVQAVAVARTLLRTLERLK